MSDPASFLSAFGGLIGGIGSIAAVWAALYVSHKAGLPQVVSYLDFDEDHNCMYLVVENCGTGVAYNVHFLDFDDSIVQESLRDAARTSFIHCGIPILAPGKVRRTLVAAGRIQDEMEDYSAKVTIAILRSRCISAEIGKSRKILCSNIVPTLGLSIRIVISTK